MSQICLCETGISNLGSPDCTKLMGRPYKLVYTKLKDSAGALNKIPTGQLLDQTYVDGLKNNLDTSVRWYTSPEVKNFISTKADPTFKSYDDGTRDFLREGVRTFTGMFKEADSVFLSYLDSVRCADAGFYVITDTGNYLGYKKDESGDVYPIPVDVVYNKLNFTSGDDIQNVDFTLDIPLNVVDSKLVTIYGATADLIGLEGLVQLSSTASNPVALGYDLNLKGAGQYGYTDGYTGLAIADLIAFNVTTNLPATVATVTATATEGLYNLTFTGAVATDVVRVSEAQPLVNGGVSFNSVELAVA